MSARARSLYGNVYAVTNEQTGQEVIVYCSKTLGWWTGYCEATSYMGTSLDEVLAYCARYTVDPGGDGVNLEDESL